MGVGRAGSPSACSALNTVYWRTTGAWQALVAVNALAFVVPLGPSALVVDGDLPVVLEREDASALLALAHLSVPGLDLAVGAPAHVAVAALLLATAARCRLFPPL